MEAGLMFLFYSVPVCTDSSDQGTDTDPCRTQVVDLIDLQAGVDLVTSIQDLINLIGGNGIKSASEGISWIRSRSSLVFTKFAAE